MKIIKRQGMLTALWLLAAMATLTLCAWCWSNIPELGKGKWAGANRLPPHPHETVLIGIGIASLLATFAELWAAILAFLGGSQR
jgi:hypothetical protein